MPTFSASMSKPASGLDDLWRRVARGEATEAWIDRLPSDVRDATVGKVPDGATDVMTSVSADGDVIVFTTTARAP